MVANCEGSQSPPGAVELRKKKKEEEGKEEEDDDDIQLHRGCISGSCLLSYEPAQHT
jgi:hypothetical protein